LRFRAAILLLQRLASFPITVTIEVAVVLFE